MYKNRLRSTTNIDSGRETWIKFCLKDYSQFYLSDSASSDRSAQMEDSTNSLKDDCDC